MKTEKQKMLAGELYCGADPELDTERRHAAEVLRAYNSDAASPANEAEFRSLFKTFGSSSTLRAPFFCDYGSNISIGDRVFMNFNCVILDVGEVIIGDDAKIGPAVQIYAADHPRDAATRELDLEFGRPVRIGKNVWIGGGAILLPGVTVGDHAVIGAGSVVTRDVPEGATVVGNPARIVQPKQR